jgi:hypothetical protein
MSSALIAKAVVENVVAAAITAQAIRVRLNDMVILLVFIKYL